MNFERFFSPDVGAVGILVLVVLLILWGMLLPRSTVRALLAAKDEQITLYRDAYEKSAKTVEIQNRQIGQLMEMARTTTHVIEAIPAALPRGREDGHAMEATDAAGD